jgi:hypothetical protein
MGIMDYMPQFGQNVDQQSLPQDDTLMQLDLKRKLALADALRTQEAPQGQMVSGHYVAPSWTQYLNNAVGQYQGGKQEREAINQFGEYQKTKQKRLADALEGLNAATAPKPVLEQSAYQIQVPNGRTPQTENLGGMQPIETGMKSIDVPMTNTTGYQPRSAAERDAALYSFATATQNPELMSKIAFDRIAKQDQQEALQAQRQYDFLLHKRDRGEKLDDTERANLFALDKMAKEQGFQMGMKGMEQQFTSGQNALSRGVTMRGQDMTNANQPLVAVLDANGQPTYVPRNQAMGKAPYNPNQAKMTETQSNANLFGTRAAESNRILQRLEGKYSPAGIQFQESMVGSLPGVSYVANKALSPETQQAAQAQRDFVTAILRKESGAAISPSEFDNARKQYFDQPGDSAQVKAQKAQNRQTAIQGIQAAAGQQNQPQVRVVDF